MNEVVMLMGIQASGKTSTSQDFINKGYTHLNRDQIGGTLEKPVPMLSTELNQGHNVLLDNTFGTKKSRKPFIEACQQQNVPIRCLHMDTSIEHAQFNAAKRIINRYGKLLSLEEIKASKDPNVFPVAVLFSYHKTFEEPTIAEGFATVEKIKFVRHKDPKYSNRALILDYDGTLNQSGIGKGKLSHGAAKACFDKTNELLGHDIDYVYCPHGSFPIACYCRKPLPGYGVHFIEKYKLDASQCIFVGDMTSDKTFAQRSGFQFVHANSFFK